MIHKLALIALMLFGVWSSGSLSWRQFQSGDACPILGNFVPACYIAFAGYLLMAIAVGALFMSASVQLHRLFWLGLLLAGGLALLGSILEAAKGDICPKAFGCLPMCYLSLVFSALIGFLYATVSKVSSVQNLIE